MAGETLLTSAELFASFPDNAANLILPLDMRNSVISNQLAIGFMEDDTASFPIVIDPTAGVTTSINLSVTPAPLVAENFWALDGNNAWIPDYTGIIVNPPTNRLLAMNCWMLLQKQGGGGPDDYQFSFFNGGVQTNINPYVLSIAGTDDSLLVISEEIVYDVAVGGAIDLRVAGAAAGQDDLTVSDFRQRVTSALI